MILMKQTEDKLEVTEDGTLVVHVDEKTFSLGYRKSLPHGWLVFADDGGGVAFVPFGPMGSEWAAPDTHH
jgi:hypothetical protein